MSLAGSCAILLLVLVKGHNSALEKEILLGDNNLFFLEFIEWFDETGREIVHRIPETGLQRNQVGRATRRA